jgi:hypothetical protein
MMAIGVLMSGIVHAVEAMEHHNTKNQWVKEDLLGSDAKRPFSFVYDGQASDKVLAAWPKRTKSRKLDAARTRHTLTWTDPKTGLEVRCMAVNYADFRREKNAEPTKVFHLSGLDPAAKHEVTDLDTGTPVKTTGRDLADRGLTIEIKDRPSAAVVVYRRVD